MKQPKISIADIVQMLLIITVSVPISFVQQKHPVDVTERAGFTKLLKLKGLTNANILNF